MKKWTLREKKKLICVLVGAALSALLGYLDTLIPPIFPLLPQARVWLGAFVAFFLLWRFSAAEGFLAWGVRCLVYGLVQSDGYAVLYEAVAGACALVLLWLLRRLSLGALAQGALFGIVWALVYAMESCITLRSGALFAVIAQFMLFYAVCGVVHAGIAFALCHLVPEEWTTDV